MTEKGNDLKLLLTQKKAALFDLDGTLVDSMWMWTEIDIEYLRRFGKDFSPKLQKDIEGMSFTETAIYFKETFSIPDSIETIKADWTDMSLEKYAHEVPLKPYAEELLKKMKRLGLKIGISTSNYREMVDACLHSLGITHYFDAVCTACEVKRGKPSPDIYLHTADRLCAEPSGCIVFEDIPAGIRAGKAAGMTVVAVDDAFSAAEEPEKRRLADYFIRDFGELLPKSAALS